ncbi:MAG: DUF721 domain-containing protein [Elusimicrobiota bacterium]
MIITKPKRAAWTNAGDLIRTIHGRLGVSGDKISILNAVWDREMGHLSRHWILSGLRGATLYIRPVSAAAAQELQLRGPEIVRRLNKYFNRPWIKTVRAAR